jgi:hypothetical protein
VLFHEADFFILNNQLFHLARLKNKKRLHLIAPRFEQLVIPKAFRMQIMQYIHEFSHHGFLKSYLTARQRFYWVGMSSDFADFISSCLVCQQIKNTPQAKYPLQSIPVSGLFSTLMIDFHTVCTDRSTRDCKLKHCLILVDQYSQFVTLKATADQKAETAARIVLDEIIMRFGCPRYLISDRGSSWLNQFFQSFLKMCHTPIFHIKTSPYKACSNSLSEIQNKSIIRHLRAFCKQPQQFHEFLPAITAGINCSVNSALGLSPYFVLFGQEYCAPICTTLSDHEQSFRDLPYPEGLKSLGDRMKILRDIVHENIKDARADTERIKNANAKPHNFEEGQRVFISQELESSKIKCRKSFPPFVGRYLILQLKGSLARLQHWNTGRILKNYIHVSKLKRLRDESRDKLYNRLRPTHSQDSTVNTDQQPTVQTALAATSSYWHPAARDNALTECTRNSFHPACLQRSGTADAADCDVSHSPAADSPIPSYTFIAQPDVHTGCTQQSSHCRAESKQRPTLAAYSPAWQVRDSNQVWPQTTTELQTKSLPAQNARIPMNHRPQEVKALCSNAAIPHSPSMHLSSRHQSPDAVQAVHLPAVTQQHFSLSLTDVSNNRQQLVQPRNFPASDTSHDSVHSKQTDTTKELISKQPERQIKTHQSGISSQGSVGSIDLTETTALDSRMTHIQSAAETGCKQNNTAYPVNSSQQKLKIDAEPQAQSQPRQADHQANSNNLLQATDNQGPVQTKSALVKQALTSNMESYQAITEPPQLGYNTDIVRVSACRRHKSGAIYKVHFKNKKKSQWLSITQIPLKILASFHVHQFQRKKKLKRKLHLCT